MVFLKINRLYLTTKKIYINKLNNKLKITSFQTKISQNIKLFIKIIKIILVKIKISPKKNFTNKKNNVLINPFKYINNQHHINKITTISKLFN